MIRVAVELWLWLGKELKGAFESPTEMRSVREELLEEGVTIGELLHRLAKRHEAIEKHVFDTEAKRLRPDVFATYNEEHITPQDFYERPLRNGDRIIIMPAYSGG
jgi:molybdopterin converting factor small subunit